MSLVNFLFGIIQMALYTILLVLIIIRYNNKASDKGKWHYSCFAYDGKTVTEYIDGVKK